MARPNLASMLLRRVLVGAPLAVLVAVGAHELGFGAAHAVAGASGPDLIAAAAALLALLAVAAPLALALAGKSASEGRAELRRWLPGSGEFWSFALFLGLGGFAALAAIEASEGHSPFATPLTLLALAAVALLAALAGPIVCDRLAVCGALLAGVERPLSGRRPTLALRPVFVAARDRAATGARCGRAPPLH